MNGLLRPPALLVLLLLTVPALLQCQQLGYEALASSDGDTNKRCKNRAVTGATLFEAQCIQNCPAGDAACTNGCNGAFITLSMALTAQCDD